MNETLESILASCIQTALQIISTQMTRLAEKDAALAEATAKAEQAVADLAACVADSQTNATTIANLTQQVSDFQTQLAAIPQV